MRNFVCTVVEFRSFLPPFKTLPLKSYLNNVSYFLFTDKFNVQQIWN